MNCKGFRLISIFSALLFGVMAAGAEERLEGEARGYGVDLGEAHVISRIGFVCQNSNAARARTRLGVFEGANSPDFSDAVPLQMIKEYVEAGKVNYFDVDCSLGVRFVRFVAPDGAQRYMAEMELYGEKGQGDYSQLWQLTNLPTVVINTADAQEPYDKEHEIASTVIIISNGGTSYLCQTGGVRERGNASRQFPKKPWRIKFDEKTAVLDSPAKAKKWTLINNYGDKTLMRNILAFEVARKMNMTYVPFCHPVDVVMNGEYKGCYQLCDQIDIRKHRLDITEMKNTDIEGDSLTGGYFVEVDAYANEEPVWFQTNRYYLPITIKSPDSDNIQPEQRKYIIDYINRMERSLPSGNYGEADYKAEPLGFPYRDVFDTESFIRHMLVNEVAGNTDCYWSTYWYKERNDPKIYTGPVWDFDLGFDNDIRTYHVWEHSGNGFLWNSGYASLVGNMRYFAQRVLIKDPTTPGEICDIWAQARQNGLSAEWLNELVDSIADELDRSQQLNFMRWPILNQGVHQNPQIAYSYEGELNVLHRYIDAQMEHLDAVMGYVAPDPGDDSLNELTAESARAYAVEGGIAFRQFEPGTPYAIYSARGHRIASGPCTNRPIALSPGLYLVVISNRTTKLLVR